MCVRRRLIFFCVSVERRQRLVDPLACGRAASPPPPRTRGCAPTGPPRAAGRRARPRSRPRAGSAPDATHSAASDARAPLAPRGPRARRARSRPSSSSSARVRALDAAWSTSLGQLRLDLELGAASGAERVSGVPELSLSSSDAVTISGAGTAAGAGGASGGAGATGAGGAAAGADGSCARPCPAASQSAITPRAGHCEGAVGASAAV